MAGMVVEDPPASSKELFELLEDFLSDAFVKTQADNQKLCEELHRKLQSAGLKAESRLEKIVAEQIGKAVVLGEAGIAQEAITADYIDPFLGIQKASVNYNADKQTAAKKKLKQEEETKEIFTGKVQRPLPLPRVVRNSGEKNINIMADRVTLMIGGKTLLDNTQLKLAQGRKYGLVGRNGVGKTCLLTSLVLGEIEKVPKTLNILYVEQEVKANDKTVMESLLETDFERTELLKLHKETTDPAKMAEIDERLNAIEAFSAEARAATILSGLGFTQDGMSWPTTRLSGGWLMRVALARALYCQPDILLLDEPTNHLDLETVVWLENFLKNYPSTVVVVSHDRAFLNNVTTDTIHFYSEKLDYFKGNYDSFEKTRNEKLTMQKKQHDAQKAKIDHMQKFIDKFRCNAKRASLVQSRIKALKKMDLIEDVLEDPSCHFIFPQVEKVSPPLLRIDDGVFAYSSEALLSGININIDMHSRIALLGRNGCGKTTLLKIFLEELELTEGHLYRHRRLRIACFTQHHIDQLDLSCSALEQLSKIYTSTPSELLRSHLGSFGISGNLALRPMAFLSGGQKSRVAFAAIAFRQPHILLLDEPTNHLDIDAVNALIVALNAYSGGLLVVSHDQHFVSSVCDELWLIKKGKLRQFKGGFEEYRKQIGGS